VSQWTLVNEQLQAREPWTITSLEVTPLVRRVAIDSEAQVARIGLSVNVSHSRLDDIRMKLIAPSGRAVELLFEKPSSSVNEVTVVDPAQLAPLRGEAIDGTWTLSLRDEATGVNGHLHNWNLSLNSQVVVESFDRGLDIPAPLERESNNIWFSADGKYAVARALQSDNARMWDLASARPARSIAVPASQSVIGLSADARHLVTLAQDSVILWSTSNGRREAALDTTVAAADVELSGDGRHLLVIQRAGSETRFDLWSLETRRRISRVRIAGAPALTAMNDNATRLAIADYDRAVRVWDFRTGKQISQLDLHALATDLRLSADGNALAIVHGDQGVSMWRTDEPTEPIMIERTADRWQLRFSPSGNLFLAGSARQGYQIYRTSDGAVSGPPMHAGLGPVSEPVLAFTDD
jgi:subtilisin-like proprotein convertase family protein